MGGGWRPAWPAIAAPPPCPAAVLPATTHPTPPPGRTQCRGGAVGGPAEGRGPGGRAGRRAAPVRPTGGQLFGAHAHARHVPAGGLAGRGDSGWAGSGDSGCSSLLLTALHTPHTRLHRLAQCSRPRRRRAARCSCWTRWTRARARARAARRPPCRPAFWKISGPGLATRAWRAWRGPSVSDGSSRACGTHLCAGRGGGGGAMHAQGRRQVRHNTSPAVCLLASLPLPPQCTA